MPLTVGVVQALVSVFFTRLRTDYGNIDWDMVY